MLPLQNLKQELSQDMECVNEVVKQESVDNFPVLGMKQECLLDLKIKPSPVKLEPQTKDELVVRVKQECSEVEELKHQPVKLESQIGDELVATVKQECPEVKEESEDVYNASDFKVDVKDELTIEEHDLLNTDSVYVKKTSTYVRKSNRKLIFTEEILEEARKRIANGESKRKVATALGTNESTLRKRLKVGIVPTSLGRHKPVFTPDVEKELVEHLKELDRRFYGLTRKQLMQLTYEFAERNNIEHRFNKETKLAGKNWVLAFCRRQGLTLRAPERCSLGSASFSTSWS